MPNNQLTKKQLEILQLLHKYRFLTRHHIQRLLNHKKHTRTNTWLQNLTKQEYVNRIYERTREGTSTPAIYYLNPRSLTILVQHFELCRPTMKWVYKESSRSQKFMDHCMTIAEIYLHYRENSTKLTFLTKSEMLHIDHRPNPIPDAYIITHTAKKIKRYFLYLIDQGVPHYAIRNMLKILVEYQEDGEWTKQTNLPFPEVLLVCPNYQVQKYLVWYTNKLREDEGASILFNIIQSPY